MNIMLRVILLSDESSAPKKLSTVEDFMCSGDISTPTGCAGVCTLASCLEEIRKAL